MVDRVRIHRTDHGRSPARPATPEAHEAPYAPARDPDAEGSAPNGHSIEKIRIYAEPEPSLTVGAPDDVYEQEADRVAGQVMFRADTEVAAPEGAGATLQRSAAPEIAPTARAEIEGLRGDGQPIDAVTRAFLEPRFSYDFRHVRIHADDRSAAAARNLHAAAFTVGSDIAFAPGRYQPQSDGGRHLLAHELTHVVQQGGGASGARPVRAAPLGIQRAVETLGGEWDTDKYELVNDGTQDIGVEIDKLHFKAKDPTDATKIGLTQMVNSIDKGSVVALNDTVKGRSIPAGQADAGSHTDRMAKYSNPIYGMADPTDKGKTLGGSTSTGNSEWGHHFKDPAGKPQHQDATLYDRPTLGDHGANASQLFETSALAVEGSQAGTYYGSVRWGWRSDASNKVTKEPLSVATIGAPSATFTRAAGLWNAGKTSTGADTVDLPIAAGTSGDVMPSAMSDKQIEARLTQIKDDIAKAPPGTATQSLQFEQNALLSEQRTRRMGDFPLPEKNPDTVAV